MTEKLVFKILLLIVIEDKTFLNDDLKAFYKTVLTTTS